MDDAQLRTVWQQRQFAEGGAHVSGPLAILMKRTLARRVRQLGRLGEVWDRLVPEPILSHTALEGFAGGTLTVMVDSAPHRFQLRMLLDGGLLRQVRQQFSGPLNKIRLVPGQFCTVDEGGSRRYGF